MFINNSVQRVNDASRLIGQSRRVWSKAQTKTAPRVSLSEVHRQTIGASWEEEVFVEVEDVDVAEVEDVDVAEVVQCVGGLALDEARRWNLS